MGLSWKYGRREPDPRRFSLPEKDCERLNRNEMLTMQMLLVLVSVAFNNSSVLKKRLECVPHGVQRYRIAVASLQAIFDDIVGTITQGQARQLILTLADTQVRVVPKMAPLNTSVVLNKDVVVELINAAKEEKCMGCIEDGENCRKCNLYKVLEEVAPLDDYGNGMLCPYSREKWE